MTVEAFDVVSSTLSTHICTFLAEYLIPSNLNNLINIVIKMENFNRLYKFNFKIKWNEKICIKSFSIWIANKYKKYFSKNNEIYKLYSYTYC